MKRQDEQSQSHLQSINNYNNMQRDSQHSSKANSRRKIFKDIEQSNLNNHYSTMQQRYSHQSLQNTKNIPIQNTPREINAMSRMIPPKHTNISPTDIPKNPTKPSQSICSQPMNFERKTMFKPLSQKSETRSINKLSALARMKYLNPLARLEYQQRESEVYTKLSRQTQQQAMMKIKARNQLANFEDDPIDQQKQIDDLIQFKLGKSGKNGFITYFQQQQSILKDQERIYCNSCESFVGEPIFPSHKQSCKFQYSLDHTQRMQQITDKLNRIYKLLLQEDESEEGQIVKKYLIDVSTADQRVLLTSTKQKLVRVDAQGQLGIIVQRIREIIDNKLDLVSK